MKLASRVGLFFLRLGVLARATAWAALLGMLEALKSERSRSVLGGAVLLGVVGAMAYAHPVRPVEPGELGIRFNRLTGDVAEVPEGFVLMVPGLHHLRVFPLRDQMYHPEKSSSATGGAPFQTVEGLSIGVDVTIRYALDPSRVAALSRRLPDAVGRDLVEPVADGVLHRVLSRHTVREVFSTHRVDIQEALTRELAAALEPDGVLVRSVYVGKVDLPAEYKAGLEGLLTEELSSEKMRYTLELKEKLVKQSALEAEAEKVRREKGAEAAGQEEIIAARARAEAMKHVLPFKEREIEQKRLEAEAQKVQRMKVAEGEAEARRIESSGEADARRTLADVEAYRMEVTGKAATQQMARESVLIRENPLLIQKAMADKLSDKVQVIIAPPQAGGLMAGALLGGAPRSDVKALAPPCAEEDAQGRCCEARGNCP